MQSRHKGEVEPRPSFLLPWCLLFSLLRCSCTCEWSAPAAQAFYCILLHCPRQKWPRGAWGVQRRRSRLVTGKLLCRTWGDQREGT